MDRLEQSDPRIESRPTPWVPIAVGASVSGLVVMVLGARALVKVDQLVSAPGKLEPIRSTQDIKAPESGVVTAVFVREGQQVKQGQALVLLDPKILLGKDEALRDQQRQLSVLNAQELLRRQEALGQTRAEQVGLLQNQRILREQVNELKKLEAQGAASRFQLLDYQKQLGDNTAKLKANQQEQYRLMAESAQKRAELNTRSASNRADQMELRTRLGRITLRAPVMGTVLNLKAKTGTVVTEAGDPLLQLVPSDNLQAKVFVPNKDLAFVRPGHTADVAIEAYDRNRFGVIKAIVSTIGTDSLPADEQYDYPRFPIGLILKAQNLQREGKSFPLQAGMAITADLKLEQRTLLELFFSNFTDGTRAIQGMR